MDSIPGETDLAIWNAVGQGQRDGGRLVVNEIYLDGKVKKAELVDEDEKSYGIFMHSLVLSNYAEVMRINPGQINVRGDELEKAIYYYTASKGFDKNLIESIAPKVEDISLDPQHHMKATTHLINEKMRIVSKGTPEELLKRCSYILQDSRFVKITRRIYIEVNGVLLDMFKRCVSVYALAIKDTSRMANPIGKDTYVNEMALVALVGMGMA
jgi:magnesium-transporting ATPase (P-type)